MRVTLEGDGGAESSTYQSRALHTRLGRCAAITVAVSSCSAVLQWQGGGYLLADAFTPTCREYSRRLVVRRHYERGCSEELERWQGPTGLYYQATVTASGGWIGELMGTHVSATTTRSAYNGVNSHELAMSWR